RRRQRLKKSSLHRPRAPSQKSEPCVARESPSTIAHRRGSTCADILPKERDAEKDAAHASRRSRPSEYRPTRGMPSRREGGSTLPSSGRADARPAEHRRRNELGSSAVRPRTGKFWAVLRFPLTRILLGALAVVGSMIPFQLVARSLGAAPSS